MSARSIRRAAERLALKSTRPGATSEPQVSPAQLAANRENSQLSTGPRSQIGKAISSLNAVKSGLTGRTVVLPSDDVAEYESNILAHQQEFKPVGYMECDLVQSIADTAWRLRRIANLEQALFCKGRMEFAEMFIDTNPAQRAALIDLHTHETYEKTFRNLHLQESRLARRREKDLAELRARQQARMQKQQDALKEAATLYAAAQNEDKPWTPEENGFDFSLDELKRFIATQPAAKKEISAQKSLITAA